MLKKTVKKEVTKGRIFFCYQIFKTYLIGGGALRSVLLFRLAEFFGKKRLKILSRYFYRKLERDYLVYINSNAEIDLGFEMPHPVGVVIGEGVRIGKNVILYQHVTLGGARRGDWQNNNYPIIGNNTVVFSGAVIVGKIKIGKNCIIGANAVVTKDVPDNSTAVGVPARII